MAGKDRLAELERRVERLEERLDRIEKTISGKIEGKPLKVKPSIFSLLVRLRDEGFFAEPRLLSDIKRRLEEEGYYYPLSSLTEPLLRAVRKRVLGRVKKEGKWAYVQR